jgi:hypothetical protein
MRQVGKGTVSPFCQPPVKALERRKQAAVGWAFFWLLFFAQTKKSNSPVGARTDIKNKPRKAKPYRFSKYKQS